MEKIVNAIVTVIICIEMVVVINLNITIKRAVGKDGNVLGTQIKQEENNYVSKVDEDEFIENLKKYLTGEKVAIATFESGNDEIEIENRIVATNQIETFQDDNIEVADNLIKIKTTDIVYELNYSLNSNEIEITSSKSVSTENENFFEGLLIILNEYNFYTAFVAYAELLGINPNEALEYIHLVITNENLKGTRPSITEIDTDIIYFKREATERTMSNILKVKNNSISKFDELLKIERENFKRLMNETKQQMTNEIQNIMNNYSSTSGELSSQAVKTFNMQFEAYEGNNKSASETKSLISIIRTNNITSDKIVAINFKGTKYENDNISSINQLVTSGNKYNVTMSYDNEGYVNVVTIN